MYVLPRGFIFCKSDVFFVYRNYKIIQCSYSTQSKIVKYSLAISMRSLQKVRLPHQSDLRKVVVREILITPLI